MLGAGSCTSAGHCEVLSVISGYDVLPLPFFDSYLKILSRLALYYLEWRQYVFSLDLHLLIFIRVYDFTYGADEHLN